ncbi:universal stress protein [Cryptosporangium aurantiacum]|uniref:Nucleotide-binding universal stress protein, UspA family n=1 Tax=Cryptosporangium aurantiacum TaxID=134849 RepID=A0A1M7TYY2_9ACTN|nr:universal stress protein [Cryptosporangium aurantiacum]SHN75929.1 Nucleotide-binding universal stress protein, UspA family [Cryptosporangium aurantiacum]
MSRNLVVTVGIDGSESALAAVDWAVEYARPRGTSLRIVTGLEVPVPAYTPYPLPDVHEAVEADARRSLHTALTRAQQVAPELDVSASVVAQRPVPALLEASRHSALLVVGCRGLNDVANVLLGSVSAAVATHAACSVAVVRGTRPVAPDAPVVVGVDGSGGEDTTLAAAFEEASVRKAPLVVAHAWSDVSLVAAAGAVVGTWPTWDRLRQEATNTVEATLEVWRAKHPSVRVGTHIVRDRPAAALLDVGRTAQLVVVGSHGRGGFAGMALGSVARRLVHHADCPVLVVRHSVTA